MPQHGAQPGQALGRGVFAQHPCIARPVGFVGGRLRRGSAVVLRPQGGGGQPAEQVVVVQVVITAP